MVDRRSAVIQDAHGERGIECPRGQRQLLESERQDYDATVVTERLHRRELGEEQDRRVDANNRRGAEAAHLVGVVAIAGADVEHALAVQGTQHLTNARPLEVTPPFGIDRDGTEVERALSPGAERLECRFYPVRIVAGRLELVERREPAGQVAMGARSQACVQRCSHGIAPVIEPGLVEQCVNSFPVDHGLIATIDTKLK